MRVRRNCLVTGIDGWVWAGVQDVLVRYRFHGDALERGSIDTLPMTAGISSMLMRRDGSVLVALNSGAILQFDRDGKFRGPLLGPPACVDSALMQERNGALWGGCTNGLVWRGQGDRYEVINHDLSERIVSIIETSRDELWVASLGSGAVRLDENNFSNRLVVNRTSDLLGDTLWCAVRGSRRQSLVRAERRRVAAAQGLPRVRGADRTLACRRAAGAARSERVLGAAARNERARRVGESDVRRHRRRPRGVRARSNARRCFASPKGC